jgi:hypothetical protein
MVEQEVPVWVGGPVQLGVVLVEGSSQVLMVLMVLVGLVALFELVVSSRPVHHCHCSPSLDERMMTWISKTTCCVVEENESPISQPRLRMTWSKIQRQIPRCRFVQRRHQYQGLATL